MTADDPPLPFGPPSPGDTVQPGTDISKRRTDVQQLEPVAGGGCTPADWHQAVVGPRRTRSQECRLFGVRRTSGSLDQDVAARPTASPSPGLVVPTRRCHLAKWHKAATGAALFGRICQVKCACPSRLGCPLLERKVRNHFFSLQFRSPRTRIFDKTRSLLGVLSVSSDIAPFFVVKR